VDVREIVNALMYILIPGRHWRAISKDLPARSSLRDDFDHWNWDGTLGRIYPTLYVKCRQQASRDSSPTAAIIDCQSVKSAEKLGASIEPSGYDATPSYSVHGRDSLAGVA
jgi:transposase